MIKGHDTVTIVLATCDGEAYLQEQIESLISQTYRPIEILICDDVSMDTTVEILRSYQQKYSFIKIHQNSERLGFVKNFENLIRMCNTPYIALCDQDDIWEPDKLELQMQSMHNLEEAFPDSACLVHSDLSMIDDASKQLGPSYFGFQHYCLSESKDLGHMLGPCGVMGNTVVMNRKLAHTALPFPDKLEVHDYWIGLIAELFGHRQTLNEQLVRYRLHENNASNRIGILAKGDSLIDSVLKVWRGKIKLPYVESKRYAVLTYLLNHYDVSDSDRKMIEEFMKYLRLEGSRLGLFGSLIRHDFVKRNFRYRFKLLGNLLLNRRYVFRSGHHCDDTMKKGFFFGFSGWKRGFIEPFFDLKPTFIDVFFGNDILKKARQMGLDTNSAVYIWGRRSFPDIEEYARKHRLPVYRVEDGFVRSVSLGSDLTRPYSLVVDSRGIYFDPTQPSDLEGIYQNILLSEVEIERARNIRNYLVENKLSKYNLYENKELDLPKEKTVVFVPGQVEDDASILYGAPGMGNLELLKQVRRNRPDAYIVYKPHPDVLSGNRVGWIEENDALRYCDHFVTTVGIDSVLMHAHEVHTMTSLVGFEALLRNIHVVTYGLPFYAGWGLCEEMMTCERRTRTLSIDELVAGALILYPRYIHPKTKKRCEIEELLEVLEEEKGKYSHSVWIKIRNQISRKGQRLLRWVIR